MIRSFVCSESLCPSLGIVFTPSFGLWLVLHINKHLLSPFVRNGIRIALFHNHESTASLTTHAGTLTREPIVTTKSAHTHTSVVSAEVNIPPSTVSSQTKSRQKKPSLLKTPQIQKESRSQKGVSPINIQVLSEFIQGYPFASYVIQGFSYGFRLGYHGPRQATSSSNLRSCFENPDMVTVKLQIELDAGRIKGPFNCPPLSELRISPIGLVPKKAPGQFRLIHHLSFPEGASVNDFIDPDLATVVYSSFDDAIDKLLELGQGALFSKTDIDSAFRLIPIHPDDHHVLGFKFNNKYYYDTCLPMGASSSCAIFERFSSALQYVSETVLNIKHMVHILDDFLILGPPLSDLCQLNLNKFLQFCSLVGVPIKTEKTENATTIITFMGLELDSNLMEARLPQDKLVKLRTLLVSASKSRKITLRDLQSLLG